MNKIEMSKLKAMSLIEMSFVMIIAGIFMAMSLQGWKYVEHVRLYSVSQQILQIKIAHENLGNAAHVDCEQYLQKLESYGGPKTVNGKIKAGSYGMLECVGIAPVVIVLSAIKPAYAHKLKGMLENGDKDNTWVVIEEHDDLSDLKINL